jgi:hypothetical protein
MFLASPKASMYRDTPNHYEMLHPDTMRRLRSVLLAGWRAAPDLFEGFREPIAQAVAEARSRGCPSERFIMLVKAIEREARLLPLEGQGGGTTRSAFHDWVVRVALESYYERARAPSVKAEGDLPSPGTA